MIMDDEPELSICRVDLGDDSPELSICQVDLVRLRGRAAAQTSRVETYDVQTSVTPVEPLRRVIQIPLDVLLDYLVQPGVPRCPCLLLGRQSNRAALIDQ